MKYSFNSNTVIRTPNYSFVESFNKRELQSFFSQKSAKESLFLASPDLLEQFNIWEDNMFKSFTKEAKLVNSLLKYALRMHSRSTPFGLFAGCNIVENIQPSITRSINEVGRKTRLDMNFSGELALKLSSLPIIKDHLKYFPNTSSYIVKNQIRYVEYFFKNKKRDYQISAVNNSIYLKKVFELAKSGVVSQDLINSLVSEDITEDDASQFINQIIESQLLVSELEPAVTGVELTEKILNVLKGIQRQYPNKKLKLIIEILESTQIILNDCDLRIGNSISIYNEVVERLNHLEIPIDLGRIFQTDLFPLFENIKSGDTTYLKTIQGQLFEAIKVLNKLTLRSPKTNLVSFIDKFKMKYDKQEVSLLQVLDSEAGIGYAQNTNHSGDINPLINGIILPNSQKSDKDFKWTSVNSFLLKKLTDANKHNKHVISINAKELTSFVSDEEDLPTSMSVMYSHLGDRKAMPFLNLKGVNGSSSVNILGRFATSNKGIRTLVEDIAEREQLNDKESILAEIVHLPENRTGNILLRPAFRKFEIPYLCFSTLPKDQQIGLDDLFISVKNNQLVLRSKRLGKVIQPMLGNAHNFSNNSLPVYHLLCDLQTQNKRSSLYFNWGPLSSEFSFLPRVEVGNVVVSRATWNINKNQIKEICQGKDSIINRGAKWQKKWKIPYLVLLIEGDNELLINLDNELSIKMFIDVVKKKPNIILKEFLFDSKTAIIKDVSGKGFTNEFVSILQKETDIKQPKNLTPNKNILLKSVPTKPIQRDFALGSDWLYYKLYCGVKSADKLLSEIIKPFVDTLLTEEIIDSWFFIRYSDPELHLRIRFHIKTPSVLGEVVQRFHSATKTYRDAGLIWKYEGDTYKREIERYGNRTMVLSEKIFFNNSQTIVGLLALIDGDDGDNIRWKFAFKSVDDFLSSFNYSDEKKMALMDRLKTSFGKEFGINKGLKLQMDQRFRKIRKDVSNVVDGSVELEFEQIFKLIRTQRIKNAPYVDEILKIEKEVGLEVQLIDFIASHIHMLLNRTFRNKQRVHELFIYDFLWRTYRSAIAQKKHRLKAELV